METKHLIYIGLFVGSTIGGLLGTIFDHGNGLGFWTLCFGTIGSFAGIWAAYKISKI